jgi:hypothetical protein
MQVKNESVPADLARGLVALSVGCVDDCIDDGLLKTVLLIIQFIEKVDFVNEMRTILTIYHKGAQYF